MRKVISQSRRLLIVTSSTRGDFTRGGERYDVILDVAGTKSWSQYRRVLNPHATLVMVGAPKTNRLLGPLGHVIRVRLAAWRGSQKAVFFVAKLNRPELDVLRELLESGKVKPVVEKRYELGEIADALRYMRTVWRNSSAACGPHVTSRRPSPRGGRMARLRRTRRGRRGGSRSRSPRGPAGRGRGRARRIRARNV